MLNESKIASFVATRDAETAKVFYGETLGLRLVADEEYAIVFDANGTTLRIQKVNDVEPHQYTALGWHVQDIEEMVRALAGRGVEFMRFEGFGMDELGIVTFPNGAKVAWFKDPDGNTLSIDQY